MMKNDCKQIVTHIKRLEGQLRTLRDGIEKDGGCENMIPLALSAIKSFDSLKARMVEGFVKNQLIGDRDVSIDTWENFTQLLKIVKA